MTDVCEISFFSCDVPHGHLVTVNKTEASAYIYVEEAAKRIARIITVTAQVFVRAVVSRVKEFVRKSFRNSGLEILRRTAVLRI